MNPDDLRPVYIFPFDGSQRMIPCEDVFFVLRSKVEEDFLDLAVISIDAQQLHPEAAQVVILDMERACVSWRELSKGTQFFMLGFPDDLSFVDFDAREIHNQRVVIFGEYGGPSTIEHLHIFHASQADLFTTYSGFSGGPVFALVPTDEGNVSTVFCGMALRGTPESGVVHFIDRGILIGALEVNRKAMLASAVQ